MRGGLLAGMLLFFWCSGAARAQDVPEWTVPEHKLTIVDSGSPPPGPPLREELEPPPTWDWPRRHLAQGRDFTDTFLGTLLYPEVSAATSIVVDNVRPTGTVEFSSWVNLQLYLLEVRVPMVSYIDGGVQGAQHVRLDLKIPFAIPGYESHRFAFTAGSVVKNSTPALSESSHASLQYGYGGHGFTVQLRGGYGYDQFLPSQPLRLGLQYGALVGFRAGPFAPMVELDAMRTTRTQSDRITLLPALRIFPGRDDSVQFGLAGLLTFSRGQDTPGKRFGGVFELKYTFL
ncbi:MAG TPA: hypothetical protein VGK67_23990 [Myxococcales bacterium]|jgi:hypothetical protein